MSMVRFEYMEPRTLSKASALLIRYQNEAKIIAGGTDLLRQLKLRNLRPRYLVNIKHIPQIGEIASPATSSLKIGAACTIGDIELSPIVKKKSFALFEAAHALGSPQIRNLATLGGNLCNAAPSAETAPILLARRAKAHIVGSKGTKTIDLESFFCGSGKTILKAGELLAHISVPSLPPTSGEAYVKHSLRGPMDIAVVNVAAVITLKPRGNKIKSCSIALGAVAPQPIRAYQAESMLVGQTISENLISEVSMQAAKESKPISDIRASATYRYEMVSVLTGRVLKLALQRARISLKNQ